ncbi:hypothetical protein [Roseibium litorale]|uniref:Protease inhibitor Inh n=1 Tax=Roseibium litorale TaxID=2803841 RepID=A0ABR9CNH8_9HYPH|nr:hypothetical protein [Roseibium litorale]MBD8892169.1 hypothetical protein [Roseibium litorale]
MRAGVCASAIASVCGGGTAAWAQIAAGAPALEGRWQTACLPIGKNGRHGMIVTLSVPEDTARTGEGPLHSVAQLYAKSDCADPTVEAVYEGNVALTQEATGQFLADQDVGTMTLTPQAPDVVALYNAQPEEKGCGLTGWQLNQPQDVSGKTCAVTAFPAAGTRLYDRAWIEGETLQFGGFPVKWDLTAAAQRPHEPGPILFERVRD